MEKTFNDFLDESLEESTETETEEVVETSEDLGIDESETNETVEEIEEEIETVTEEETETVTEETKEEKADFKAFAEMRVKNKQLAEEKEKAESEKLKTEALAKKLGYGSIDEMLEAATLREIEVEAKKQNIPVEVMTQLKTLENKLKDMESQKIREDNERKERTLIKNIDDFFTDNKLSEKEQADTLNALSEDGFEYEALLNMPEKSILRILGSYMNKEVSKQKQLAEKAKIQKEIPLTPTEKVDSVDKSEEDKLFEYFSGQRTDF